MLLQRTEPHARRAAPRMRRESGVRCSCRARALSLRARAEAAQPGLLPEAALARRVVHRRSQRRRRAATSLGRTYESQERMRRIQSVAHGWTCVRGEGANVVTSRGRVFWGLRRAGAGGRAGRRSGIRKSPGGFLAHVVVLVKPRRRTQTATSESAGKVHFSAGLVGSCMRPRQRQEGRATS